MRTGQIWSKILLVAGSGVAAAISPAIDFLRPFHETVCRGFARSTDACLTFLGVPAFSDGPVVYSLGYSMHLIPACNGMLPATVVLAAILLLPLAWKRKALLAPAGILGVLALNQIRLLTIVSLGTRSPRAAQIFHDGIWPLIETGLFLLLAWVWFQAHRSRNEKLGESQAVPVGSAA